MSKFTDNLKSMYANVAARTKAAAEVTAREAERAAKTETGKTVVMGAQVGAAVGVGLVIADTITRVYKATTY